MTKIFSLIIICLFNLHVFSQKVLKEAVLSGPGKSLDLIGSGGLKSAVRGAGPANTHGLISSLEFTDIRNNGFLTRKNYSVSKYNDALEKEWEAEVTKEYGLQSLPSALTIGDQTGIFFIQISQMPASFNQLHITRFDSKGQKMEKIFSTEKKYEGVLTSYINKEGCHLLVYKVDKKIKKILYYLLSISSKDLSAKDKLLGLETDEYEYQHESNYQKEHLWFPISIQEDRIVLSKRYFKDIKESKNKDLIIKTTELNFDGSISNLKTYTFDPILLVKSKYGIPTLELDTQKNELYIFGMLMIDSRSTINGIYVNKFNYNTGALVFTKEIEFSSFEKYISNGSFKKSIHYSINDVFPVTMFVAASEYLDVYNHGLRLLLFNQFKKMTGLRLNSQGELVQLEEYIFKNNLRFFNEYYLVPEKITKFWSDTGNDYKPTSLDFIHSFSGKIDPEYTLFKILPKYDGDIVISVREKDGAMHAYKLEKPSF